ncbi:MAG: Mov34/MPN/PAD-1 family protein [Acidobacteria bacterium]|nr:Mov34/MPN/PAD-1 family protein [Acidobacteriota bacterium]
MQPISYRFNHGAPLGPPAGALEYIVGADGLYLRAERAGLRFVGRIAEAEVRGLAGVTPMLEVAMPPVPVPLLLAFLSRAAAAWAGPDGPVEALAYLTFGSAGWEIHFPDVVADATSVRPADDMPAGYADAIVEIHSHHGMPARFSATDDRDEVGFRMYAVVGGFGTRPELSVRLGVYGYFFPLEASEVFEYADAAMEAFAEATGGTVTP